ncbi:amino acid carrier protein [Parachlamydia sp. AcF125]|uniref:amino acid carrier protein n=1 Tax=Parachlamydia sp. AcF125 TaxID=2795736 RepID=UPI001BC9D908
MIDAFFYYLSQLDSIFWSYIAFVLVMILGAYLTIHTRFFQIRAIPSIFKTFLSFLSKSSSQTTRGVHPLRTFFASVGGMIGIGNIVGIVTAVQMGGPGALFWVWIAALVGGIIKYAEVFLGIKHRVTNNQGGYDGGPKYFLRSAFNNPGISVFVAILLCIYGVEIYQFSVVTNSLSTNFGINRYAVIASLLGVILYAGIGGIPRVSKICSWIMPFFMVVYLGMSFWIIFNEIAFLPGVLQSVFISAFTGHAAVGGFAGSSALLAIQHGISRAAYSSDIGIGYDSIIQSESSTVYPERQARLAILGVCIDNLVCTMSILIVLLSGVWTAPIEGSSLVQQALGAYFPFMHVFIPVFLLIVGYTTMIAYFCVGIKCARFLSPTYGFAAYVGYAIGAFLFFSFFDQTQALLVMSVAGSLLLITNLLGIFKLRHQIVFSLESTEKGITDPALSGNGHV